MKLQELASLLLLSRIEGNSNTEISGIEVHSQKVRQGDLFICIPGPNVDGHDFVDEALIQGASALVTERKLNIQTPQVIVPDSRYAMIVIANFYYKYPSDELKVVGVTGTNGKTTTTYLIDKILRDRNKKTGLMGTIQMVIDDKSYDVKNTTQDALELQYNFRRMMETNTEYCIMEVSSHALQMGRVKGSQFRTAVFTNLTQDHLDFHGTMEQYREAKGLLFSRLGNSLHKDFQKFAVLNSDDPATEYFKHLTAVQIVTYGIDSDADVKASDLRVTAQGTTFKVHSFAGHMEFQLQLVGKFSVYNALAAISTALIEGISLDHIKESLQSIKGIDGRFEVIQAGQPYIVIVDYAHTPDSLENVLKTIQEFAEGRIYCVVGCGGDRDRTKRPIMGNIAAKHSDYVLVTSDNPRTENPQTIIRDVEKGVIQAGFRSDQYECIVDRKVAIEKAVEMSRPKDVILIAGKGHETYQEINGVQYSFDDRIIVKKAIRSLQGD